MLQVSRIPKKERSLRREDTTDRFLFNYPVFKSHFVLSFLISVLVVLPLCFLTRWRQLPIKPHCVFLPSQKTRRLWSSPPTRQSVTPRLHVSNYCPISLPNPVPGLFHQLLMSEKEKIRNLALSLRLGSLSSVSAALPALLCSRVTEAPLTFKHLP